MEAPKRLVSVDVFRGLTIAAMILVNYPGSYENTYGILSHSHWNGITPTDLIFPFFIFIMGVSVTLSFSKQIDLQLPRKLMVKKILIRSLKIYLIGLFIHYLPYLDFSFIDLFGVLQRIAIVYLSCSLIYIYSGWKTQIYIFIGILIAYWISLSFIPTNQFSAGTIEPGLNFASWFDRLLFSADMLGKHGWNSEGLYSTFPAIASGISGMIAGRLIAGNKLSERSVIWLFTGGIILIILGEIWNMQFPINKSIWTSSYVLYSSGWAAVLLATFIWFIDFMNLKNNLFARLGLIFGMNAIAIYVTGDIFQTIYYFTHIQEFVYNGLIENGMAAKNASLVWSVISVSSCFVVAVILYRKKIFIKI